MNDLDRIQRTIGGWAEATFDHTAEGIADHIKEEAQGLIDALEAGNPDKIREEAADIEILVLTFANFVGFSLYDAVMDPKTGKHAVNQSRTWVRCDDGITRHSGHAKATTAPTGPAVGARG
jgi:NTP pyrophosphatase (non-canonical NTP hydrolase)